MAIVGENGAGKSTVLQAAASIYAPERGDRERFASKFFPDTAWDQVRDAEIRYGGNEGDRPFESSVRKPTERWRGNPRRSRRHVEYIDLSRIQPVPARTGYSRLATSRFTEASSEPFEQNRLARFSKILGRRYDSAKMALTTGDPRRTLPVIQHMGATYSGFHQGAGETTMVELLQADIPRYSLVLIDEIESSLHPRAQRRLIRELAELCRNLELQIILSTHSPYILEELPPVARAYIMESGGDREIIYGVSPDFAMSQMDDLPHTECDLYVEDRRSASLLTEILSVYEPGIVNRCQFIPYGAASAGSVLGKMAIDGRFPRYTAVFLDGDNEATPGCAVLPGEDAPERVVFEALRDEGWVGLSDRLGRLHADVADACEMAMTLTNHHDWVSDAASRLVVGGDTLWQCMCAEWARRCLAEASLNNIGDLVRDILAGIPLAEAIHIPTTVEETINQPTGVTPELFQTE